MATGHVHDDRVLAIMKFGSAEYIEQFVRGLMYMNTLDYFVRAEGDSARHDPQEGVASILQATGGTFHIKIENEYQPILNLVGAIRYRRPEDLTSNVFCMYALLASASANSPLVDERNLAFGDTFARLLDGDEFLRRVTAAAQQSGYELRQEMVQYVDDNTYSGPLGIFRKSSRFAYQSEFRIALLPGKGEPYPFTIGDLSDIVTVGPLDELIHRTRIVHSASEPISSTP